MNRIALFLLFACVSGSAEDAQPPENDRMESALRDVVHDIDFVRDEARQVILTAGTSSLPLLRAKLKKSTQPKAIHRLATVIEILEVLPKEREVVDSIGPFALATDGRTFATFESEKSVLFKSRDSELRVAPREQAERGARMGIAPKVASPIFLGARCIGIPLRDRIEIALFEPQSADRCGSLVPKLTGFLGHSGGQLRSVLRLDDNRFVCVCENGLWVEQPTGESWELTTPTLQKEIQMAVAQDIGIVALCRDTELHVARWDSRSLKLMVRKAVPLEVPSLLDAARKTAAVVIGSKESAEVALSTSVWLEFDKPRASGLGKSGLSALALSPDGVWIAMGSPDGKVLIRLSTTWEKLAEFQPGGKISQLAFSDDGTTLGVQAGEKLHVYGVRFP
ncbi:MAG: hypothetical protein AAB074_18310 [Planctomycetota bacterium]